MCFWTKRLQNGLKMNKSAGLWTSWKPEFRQLHENLHPWIKVLSWEWSRFLWPAVYSGIASTRAIDIEKMPKLGKKWEIGKKLGKRGKIGKKRQKSGRFFNFAPPDREGWLRYLLCRPYVMQYHCIWLIQVGVTVRVSCSYSNRSSRAIQSASEVGTGTYNHGGTAAALGKIWYHNNIDQCIALHHVKFNSIFLKSHMWHDQGEWVTYRQFSILIFQYKLLVH